MDKTSNSKPKILMLITLGELGGAQKYVRDLAAGLKDQYDITIGSGVETGSTLLEWAEKNGIRTVQFPHLRRGLSFGTLPALRDFPFWLNLIRHMRQKRYSVVHLNSSKVGYLGALATFFVPGIKAVFTAHGWAFEDPTIDKKWLWVSVNKFGAYFLDRIIVLSDHDFESALKHHIAPPRKLFKIYNGFDQKQVNYLPREDARAWLKEKTGIPTNTPVVGTIANLYKTKDLKTLIAATAREKKHIPHLVIIGGAGSQPKEGLEKQAELLGMQGRVHFIGKIENAAQYLKAFDVFAISSVKEGLLFAMLEAMGAGVPIVATPVGGNNEVLFKSTKAPAGLKVPIKNPQEMARTIEKVLSDNTLAETLTSRAKRRLKKDFSYAKMIEHTKWVYRL